MRHPLLHPFRLVQPLLALIAFLCIASATAHADELAELITKVDPPARFAEHTPRFSVEERTFSFQHVTGTKETKFRILKDGDRFVAVIPESEFRDGTIFLLAFRPEDAPAELAMPTGRWHIDTSLGAEMKTEGLIPRGLKGSDVSLVVSDDGSRATYTRRYKGETTQSRLRSGGQQIKNAQFAIDETNTFVLSLDPATGYTVSGTFEFASELPIDEWEFVSGAPRGRYSLWPDQRRYFRTVITPEGVDGWVGWATNQGAIGKALQGLGKNRDGGFTAYLNQDTGWSAATTLGGGPASMAVCTAHADVDFRVTLPAPPIDLPDSPTPHRYRVHHRLLGLPPEVTRVLWDGMSLRFDGDTQLMLRVGGVEDFEDQPLPLTGDATGIKYDAPVTTDHAHSGHRSMLVEKELRPGGAQINLQPNTTYRLSAWVKLVPDESGDTARGPTEAWITGNLYEWSPFSNTWVVEQETHHATSATEDWQEIHLEFTTPEWDPFIFPVFRVKGGKAYLDDFSLAIVENEVEPE